MKCQCCKKSKNKLYAKLSELIVGNKLLLCAECKKAGHEPRSFVIISAVSGTDIRRFVVGRRYCGNELAAHEVMR
jgi:hypothetical protein